MVCPNLGKFETLNLTMDETLLDDTMAHYNLNYRLSIIIVLVR